MTQQTADLFTAIDHVGVAVSDLDAAITSYERALELFERISDTSFELHVSQSLASIHFQLGRVGQARDLADRTIARADEVGDEHWAAVAQVVRARILLSDGDPDDAKKLASRAERMLGTVGDQIQRAHALRVIAASCEALGETLEADRAFRQAIELFSSIDDRADLTLAASEYSQILRARGAIDEAFEMLELAHRRA